MKKKKGSILILFIATMICIFVLAAAFLNIFVVWITMSRAQEAANEAARTRAQAIDILLKEQEGVVEAYHNQYYGDKALHDAANSGPNTTNQSPHILNPYVAADQGQYLAIYYQSNDVAAQAGVDYLNVSVGNNIKGNQIIDISKRDFCFDVKPLPDIPKGSVQSMTFDCTTANGDVVQASFNVSGLKDNYANHIQVTNVVFAGFAFHYNTFFDNALASLGWTSYHPKKLAAIAYPQIDKCFSGTCQ